MRDLATLLRSASMDLCLDAFAALAAADDLAPDEIALRLAQYAECVRGLPCPEVAFDPTAVHLRAIEGALRDLPEDLAAWRRRALDAIEALSPRCDVARAA